MPIAATSRASALKRLRCATPAEVKWWLDAHLNVPGKHPHPPLSVFCADAVESWCEEQAAAGNCFRRDRKRRAAAQ